MWLGECIKQIDDPRVRTCSERAQWLRHDETHYQRKWEDKDISHLKELIHLVTNWIESVEITKKYEAEMPKKSPTK